MIETSTPVVVLPCGLGHSSTAIVRSLGHLGVAVYSIECTSGAFASLSRYCKGKCTWDDSAPTQKSIEILLEFGRKIGHRSILIATTDHTATLVAENAGSLKEWFIFPELCSRLARSLCNKKGMYHLARRLGIVTPEAAFPLSRKDVLNFLETATFPIMLKGIDGNRLAKRTGKKMFIAQNDCELLAKYDSVEDPQNPNLMLQEYIPGDDETVCGLEGYYNASSECLFAVTGRKIRQWPAYKGVTTLGVCLKNEAIEKITNQFMKAIDYKGILDIGYRYDARDGLYKVLDVNPRIGCTFRLFVGENGMDVARALYLDMTEQPVPRSTFREGRKWLVEDLDAVSSLHYWKDRKLTLRQWLGSFRGVQEVAYFALDDPLPFLAMCWHRGKELVKRAVMKLVLHDTARARPVYSPNRWA